jgi:hypothetical protein
VSTRAQIIRDAHVGYLLRARPEARQQAMVDFILGCNQMAQQLRQFTEARQWLCHPLDSRSEAARDEAAELIERAIGDEYRKLFGQAMIPVDARDYSDPRTAGMGDPL